MKVETTLYGIRFEWDSEKAATNLRKHGVSFEIAREAFFDPFVRVVEASGEEEARDALIGMTREGRLLFVVHIEHADEIFRLISARPTTMAERRLYEDG
ncbi:BrnT family toxin [Acidiferrobacter sp.]|uniref:BrnT family toxin n=1 Tax=Acidiferrobacter sp. TaxID=1872107 RepID=UPI00262FEBE2|nr:BrnT family toxin [Acidiferrobacter sp.]